MDYEQWAAQAFLGENKRPNTWFACNFSPSTTWGGIVAEKMREAEKLMANDLLDSIRELEGAIVEFGVFEGDWLESLIEHCEATGQSRHFLGFDSFEGLPKPSVHDDGLGWEEGQFSATLESVELRLKVQERSNVTLIPGWFSDSVNDPRAAAVDAVAYARIDGDLYESAVDSLNYLTNRLIDGSILVFDDWTFDQNTGETRAFDEWRKVAPFKFESLGFIGLGRLYMRVHKA